jgi:hypothetical protein
MAHVKTKKCFEQMLQHVMRLIFKLHLDTVYLGLIVSMTMTVKY